MKENLFLVFSKDKLLLNEVSLDLANANSHKKIEKLDFSNEYEKNKYENITSNILTNYEKNINGTNSSISINQKQYYDKFLNVLSQKIDSENIPHLINRYKNTKLWNSLIYLVNSNPFDECASKVIDEKCDYIFINNFDAYNYLLDNLYENIKKYAFNSHSDVFIFSNNIRLLSTDYFKLDNIFLIDGATERMLNITKTTDKELRVEHNLQKLFDAGCFGNVI